MANKNDKNKVMKVLERFEEELRQGLRECKLTIDDIEKLMGKSLSEIKDSVIEITGEIMAEETKDEEEICKECGKTLKKNKKREQPLTYNTEYGEITIVRNMDYCSYCGKLFGQGDNRLGLDRKHRATKGFIELTTYVAQLVPGFSNASDVLLRLRDKEN